MARSSSDDDVKLRIRDNSVRLRLTRAEVQAVGGDGRVEGRTRFAETRDLTYVLESCKAATAVSASFDGETILVRLPEGLVSEWAGSDQVSIRAEIRLPDGDTLTLLVEKDFACLAPREGEDESDMFPHPGSGAAGS